MLLIGFIAAYVFIAILPFKGAMTFHFVLAPLSLVDSLVCPSINPIAINAVIQEIPFIAGSVRPVEPAMALFGAIMIFSLILCPIWPQLLPIPLLFVVVSGSLILCSLKMDV